jgi:hypothetical protein
MGIIDHLGTQRPAGETTRQQAKQPVIFENFTEAHKEHCNHKGIYKSFSL